MPKLRFKKLTTASRTVMIVLASYAMTAAGLLGQSAVAGAPPFA